MRYIKLFEGFKEDVLEFTEDHLAYLMDDGFEITTYGSHNYGGGGCTKIAIVKRSGSMSQWNFTWEEIEDKFSPFIYMLNKQYRILEIVFHQNGGRQYQYDTRKDIEELLSGEADQYLTNNMILMITIIVKE
jgi:hypothetical protein